MTWLRSFIGNKAFYKEMFRVALPIAFQQFISATVMILDSAMIGLWGLQTLPDQGSEVFSAAIMIANRYTTTVDNIMVMLAISCTIFIAQYLGAKQENMIKKVFGIALILTSTFGFMTLIIGVFFSREVIEFFATAIGAGQDMTIYGTQYLSLIAWTFIPYSATVAMTFSLRAVKKTTIPLIASGLAAVSNIILNFVFIYGLHLGIQGAAIATIIARVIEFTVLFIYVRKFKPEFYGSLKMIFAIPRDLIIYITRKGIPIVGAQILTESLAIFMFFTYARIDAGNASNIAAINLSARVVDLVSAFIGGMGTAAIILVGSRLGAGKVQEARQNAKWQMGYISIFSVVTILIMMLCIPVMQSIFLYTETTNALLVTVMMIQAFSLPFFFIATNVIFITRAGGFTRAPVFITNLPYLLIKLPLVIYVVFIQRDWFNQQPWLQTLFAQVGLELDVIIIIFILDRLIEVVRAIIAIIVYKFAPWDNDLTMIPKRKKQQTKLA
jgi:putative MATE family efflux protein